MDLSQSHVFTSQSNQPPPPRHGHSTCVCLSTNTYAADTYTAPIPAKVPVMRSPPPSRSIPSGQLPAPAGAMHSASSRFLMSFIAAQLRALVLPLMFPELLKHLLLLLFAPVICTAALDMPPPKDNVELPLLISAPSSSSCRLLGQSHSPIPAPQHILSPANPIVCVFCPQPNRRLLPVVGL